MMMTMMILRQWGISFDALISPFTKGFLRIPAGTLPGWIEAESHCDLRSAATLLNEQDLLKAATLLCERDLLKATGQKSNHSSLTVNKLLNKHRDQSQHAITNGQLKSKEDFDTDTGTVMVTCHHKQIHQKDFVITRILIFGAACTHPLFPPMLSSDHPSSTDQGPVDRAKVRDPVFKEEYCTSTLNAIHHHREENMRILRDELQHLPPKEKISNIASQSSNTHPHTPFAPGPQML